MKNIMRKKCYLLCLFTLLLSSCLLVPTSASEMVNPSIFQEAATPYTSDIVKYYRMHNGKLQYRRYNTKTKKWVDPYWIDVK